MGQLEHALRALVRWADQQMSAPRIDFSDTAWRAARQLVGRLEFLDSYRLPEPEPEVIEIPPEALLAMFPWSAEELAEDFEQAGRTWTPEEILTREG